MRAISLVLGAGLMVSASAQAVNVSVDQSDANWLGFMNVSELDGTPVFGSPWGVSDLVATFDDPNETLTLSPNTIGDPDPFWYQGGGGPGAPGNKIMEANLYQEVLDGSFAGQTVTFDGEILSNSFTSAHESFIFIRDFAPDFSSVNETIIPITGPGAFSISLNTINDPARPVQWGFQTVGVNVWVTDVDPFGEVVIRTIPTPGAAAMLGLAGLAATRRRR
ncbi:MAG: hypothetical protein RIB32_02640 [Phycisphaerales bacterium]